MQITGSSALVVGGTGGLGEATVRRLHAAGAKVVVRLAHRDAEVAMQVENGPSDAGAADAHLPSGGNGLVGMRERVHRLGGAFVSGPTDAGGFRVSAVLPDQGAA